jgi:transaldolase
MTKNPIQTLYELKQSVWYDNINRGLLENGEIARMINAGDIQGMTSNPTIFEKAIAKSNSYDEALKPLIKSRYSPEDIFYKLAVEDIQNAADLFLPLYKQTNYHDGYVSLEVSPYLANDTLKTCDEADRLWKLVDRPNVMIKIPGTLEGIEAVRKTIAKGINVNVTLIFSRERYEKVIEAFMQGLEERVKAGLQVESIASVASFFISRVDSKVDKKLEGVISSGSQKATQLLGKVAIANSQLAYGTYLDYFNSPRWMKLKQNGAREQRPLWASTSTKNPAYSDVLYMESLIFPNTVNTVPHETLFYFKDHGNPSLSEINKEKSQQVFSDLEQLGISMDEITSELEIEGVKSFSDSFTSLLKTIGEKKISP